MAKIAWKPGTMLAPVPPVMVTCGTMERPNVLTIAWTGIVNTEPPLTYISVRPSRYSHVLIREQGEFVINLTTLSLVKAADFCGVKSGRDLDKFAACGLEVEPCLKVRAPMLKATPVALECKVKSVTSFPTHDMFLGEIVNVNVDSRYIDANGRLELEKSGLVAYLHGEYYTLGRFLGKFGFSVQKNPSKAPKKEFRPGAPKKVAKEKRPFKTVSKSTARPAKPKTGN